MPQPVNIYVKLPGDIANALIEVSMLKWRNPREQAGLYIAEGLRRDGVLPAEQTHSDRSADRAAVAATK